MTGLTIALIILLLVMNTVWYAVANKMNEEWLEDYLEMNDDWADLCIEIAAQQSTPQVTV